MLRETRRPYAKDAPIHHAGDKADKLRKVLRGAVMVFRIHEDGRRQVVDLVTAGEIVEFQFDGELATDAVALTECEIVEIPVAQALSDPDWAQYIFDQMRARLDRERRHVALLGQKSAAVRLAEFLILTSDRLATPLGELELPMTRQQIADYTGLTIETVSRLFARWAREKRVVPIRRNTYRIEGELLAA